MYASAAPYGAHHPTASANGVYPSSTTGNGSSAHPSQHHGPRSRRAPRHTPSQHSHRSFRSARAPKDEAGATAAVSAFRQRYELSRGFDDVDDMEFCADLLTEDDLQSLHSSASDRSSLSSGSPSVSPVQPHLHVTPPFSLSTASVNGSYHGNTGYQASVHQPHLKMHQPSALRSRNAIPIVNPSTGVRIASPPKSVSPARMHAQMYQARW